MADNDSETEGVNNEQEETNIEEMESGSKEKEVDDSFGFISKDIIYGVNDTPPPFMLFILALQQFLTMFSGSLTIPLLLGPLLCIPPDDPVNGSLITTLLFMSGISSFLQTTFGVRLPIIQGGSFAFIVPTITLLTLDKWKCPSTIEPSEITETWQLRMREVQGSIMVASVVEIFIGFSGVLGLILRFITPLTIAPTITLVGLSLFKVAADNSGQNWTISFLTFCLVTMFSVYLSNIELPFPNYSREKKFHFIRLPLFKLFPVLFAILISWFVCFIWTMATDKNEFGAIRTDDTTILDRASIINFPYPAPWGLPTVSLSATLGMIAGVFASMIESIGDYYACARLSGARPPPPHALNRGIFIEGISCFFSGLIGTGAGLTTFSQNIGTIGITKVSSLRVIQVSSLFMIFFSIFGKVGALFSTIPGPVIGGLLFAMFGIVSGVGLSMLQYVNMNSSRNVFIVGVSLTLGLGLPYWIKERPDQVIVPDYETIDQVLRILLSTNMLIGGFVGFILDNTIPGTDEERGVIKWKKIVSMGSSKRMNDDGIDNYDLPYGKTLRNVKCFRYFPIFPSFKYKT